MAAKNGVSQSCVGASAPQTLQQQIAGLPKRTNQVLLEIIKNNFRTQYGSQAPSLAEFRDAVSTRGGTNVDAELVAGFRAHVPLSNYDSYKPFIDKFYMQPCKEEDVRDMLAPGLPDRFSVSSGTSGGSPKVLLKYDRHSRSKLVIWPRFFLNREEPVAALVCTRYREVRMIERAPGEVVKQIPVCSGTGGNMRKFFGRYIDDESQMSFAMPGYAVPWAATVIGHFPSFMIIHGLFFLAQRNVYRFRASFATQFVDLIRHIDEHWDMLVSCIKDGVIPDLEGICHVREYLQAHFHADPRRAAELLQIGPPFSSEGWVARVWPNSVGLSTVCGGPFATALPKVRFILGPNIPIRYSGYVSSEGGVMGMPLGCDVNNPEFFLESDNIIEFLDVSLDPSHENLCQAWEVEVGKQYEPILTTRDGLWRYRQGDVLRITGFYPETGSPTFMIVGRRSMTLRLPFTQIRDDELLSVIQAVSLKDSVRAQEFTTVVDSRASLPTVGFFIELAGRLGPNAHLAPRQLFDALFATNSKFQLALDTEMMRLPTIRIVKAGTFAEYRQWKSENGNIPHGQVKIPVVLFDPVVQEWFLKRVVREL